jgi:hypothetical protein
LGIIRQAKCSKSAAANSSRVIEDELTWYGEIIDSKEKAEKMKDYFKKFEEMRSKALNQIYKNFNSKLNKEFKPLFKINKETSIAIALTSGYSAVLKCILEKIIDSKDENNLNITIIKTGGTNGYEELLQRELTAFCTTKNKSMKCSILSIDALLERDDILSNIKNVLIGIDSMNLAGDIVHPRGGIRTVIRLKEKKTELKVFAFGESYKVQNFVPSTEIDHEKLLVMQHNQIDYIITDHGVHAKDTNGLWKCDGKPIKNFECCEQYWSMKKNYD